MEQKTDSDLNDNSAMITTKAFETIIEQVRCSNLNFQLQMTPFSALISLKKSLITHKSGVPQVSPTNLASSCSFQSCLKTEIEAFSVRNIQLEGELDNLKVEYGRVVDDCNEAYARIKY